MMELSAKLTEKLLTWYDNGHRSLPWRENPTPYAVWVSEIMLQQTRVEAVRPYFLRFMTALPDVHALASADEDLLFKLWEGLGYYRRVFHMQQAAKIIVKEYGGKLPASYDALRALPGIGDYTAGAISSIAFGLSRAAVDGNVLRVIMRFVCDDRDISSLAVKREVAAALEEIYPPARCGDFTQSLMELGALVCLPNTMPHCEKCPLADLCLANLRNCADELPVKPAKKQRRIEHRTVLLLRHQGRIAVEKRSQKGLLQGLWQLPNFLDDDTTTVSSFLEEHGIVPEKITPHGHARHIFTHIEWQMQAYEITCKSMSSSFYWALPTELKETLSLPSAFQHFSQFWSED